MAFTFPTVISGQLGKATNLCGVGILAGREAIHSSVCWAVGNGENLNIREAKWLAKGVIGGPTNRDEPKKVSELMIPGTSI